MSGMWLHNILPVTLSRLNPYTDFNEIWHAYTIVLEKGHRLLLTVIKDTRGWSQG